MKRTTLAQRIRDARDAKGLTQAETDWKAGLCYGTVSHYENGRREPRMKALRALAKALGVRVADLAPDDE